MVYGVCFRSVGFKYFAGVARFVWIDHSLVVSLFWPYKHPRLSSVEILDMFVVRHVLLNLLAAGSILFVLKLPVMSAP